MATVTQLTAQKKDNERISVFVDGEFLCGLAIDDVVKSSLVVGMELSSAEVSHLLSVSGENDMFNKALVYILKNPRTEIEIKRFLSRKKDCSPEMTARIIERLKTMNYINDEAYAKLFAATKHVKMSVRAIKSKLRNKGVKTEYVDDATQDVGDQTDLAKSVAEKYMRYREIDSKNTDRLFRYLLGKGFEYDVVNEIVAGYKNRREINPDAKAKYDTYQSEYMRAREQLKSAKLEARRTKNEVKKLRKEIVSNMDT